jgi:hypothetical protein
MITKDMYESSLMIVENYKIQQKKADRVKNREICSKCGKEIGKGWESEYNRMKLYIDSAGDVECCIFGEEYSFKRETHPSIQEGSGNQHCILEIRNDSNFRLCSKCYDKLIKLIGDYINTSNIDK